jgi:hypothetical protein
MAHAPLNLFNPIKTLTKINRGVDSPELDEELRVILAFGKLAEAPLCIACELPVSRLVPPSLLGWQRAPGGRNLIVVCRDCQWIPQDELVRSILDKLG